MRFLRVLAALASLAVASPSRGTPAPHPRPCHGLTDTRPVPLDQSLPAGPAAHHARGVVYPTCNRTLIEQATHGCAQLARTAAKQAASGPTDLLRLFFKSADAATRANISRTYDAIADECAAGGTGAVSLSCDSRHYCGQHSAEFTRAD